MTLKYQFEYFLTKLVAGIAQSLSLKNGLLLGDIIGDLFYFIIRTRKKVALNNLRHAFQSTKSDSEIHKILRSNYRHFGRMLMEFARLPLLKRETILQEIQIKNRHYIDDLLKKKSGLIVFTGHLGNWEYLSAAMANIGPPLYCVFKQQKNWTVDRMIYKVRCDIGMRPLKVKGGAAKGVISALKQHAFVLIANDQDAGGRGKFVEFLGRAASTNEGPALIAIKYRVPVIMAFGIRDAHGLIKIHLYPFPDIDLFPDNGDGVKQFLIEYNKILETAIRTYPEQYFWMHRRWKTQKKEQV